MKKTFQYGEHPVTIETGGIARQADAAVLVNMSDTVVLVTVVATKTAPENPTFFPLTVNYQERTYAAGKIPGGYFKREGRPTEKETLISRLIDRPIRPMFPEGFYNEVQIIATVMSLNPEVDADVPAMLGASAALSISGIPFNGPIGAARVAYVDGQYILNPRLADLGRSQLDMVVAGTRSAVLMVESQASELSEAVMLGAVQFASKEMQVAIQAIQELAEVSGRTAWKWAPVSPDVSLEAEVSSLTKLDIGQAYQVADKQERQELLKGIRAGVLSQLSGDGKPYTEKAVSNAIEKLESQIVRERVLQGGLRIDGRDTETVRPIQIETGLLPRAHGSALFTRGETQALVVATLGTGRDAQIIDALEGETKESFMLHYNFPPYCVGEVGMMSGPKRREIGHGRLAKRSLQAVIPAKEQFPYVLRVVSEITESNGSSSMATVCGTSLALMDAGVPIKSAVAGIAMGLVKEGDRYVVLTDILGDEDHLGDMDFKVAGTGQGITALQMDIKIDGITEAIMRDALEQAHRARLHILGKMQQVIAKPRHEMSDYAPRLLTIKIHTDKIREVIGKGGVTIRALTEETGASIDISEDGLVTIASVDKEAGLEALRRIEELTADVKVGAIYQGKVVKIMEFGAFVGIMSGKKEGLLHISQISHKRIGKVSDVLAEGQALRVQVLEIDKQGRIRLSTKAIEETSDVGQE